MKVIHVSGKRKSAIARVTLKPGKGIVRINSFPVHLYQPEMYRLKLLEPLLLAEGISKKVDIAVLVDGGGRSSQTDASRLGIGKALAKFHPTLKKVFLNYDRTLLVADIRRKETYKPNDSKARKARQKSYR